MTAGELADHTDRLKECLRVKEHQLRYELLTPHARSDMEFQINALIVRVDQLDQGLTSLVQGLSA